jgi:type III restriction enzyme
MIWRLSESNRGSPRISICWKRSEGEIWIIETKGREDLDDLANWERLQQWCADATAHDGKRLFHAL